MSRIDVEKFANMKYNHLSTKSECSSVGRIHAWGAWGRGFESRHSDSVVFPLLLYRPHSPNML